MRLNEQSIRAIPDPATGYRLIVDDEIPGFAIRVTAGGVRAFVLTYSIDGRQRRYTIGQMPAWSATAARAEAKSLRVRVDRGEDPLEAKQERRGAITFGELAKEYLDRWAVKKRSGDADRAQLERDVLPVWRHRKAQDITRSEVIRLIEAKAETAPIGANRLLALVRKVYNFGIERDLVPHSPCVQVKAPAAEVRRKRVLNAEEIRTFWEALNGGTSTKLSISSKVRSILKLVLVTAQRPGECCGLEWSEIDGSWWTIPAEKTKNGRTQRVPLTEQAQAILHAIRKESAVARARENNKVGGATADPSVHPPGGRYVFQSPRRGCGAIQENALTHALRTSEWMSLDHFTAHDLRRTASDWMARLGIDGRARSAVMNHTEPGVTERHYTVYTYDKEKERALTLWDGQLGAILAGKQSEKGTSIL